MPDFEKLAVWPVLLATGLVLALRFLPSREISTPPLLVALLNGVFSTATCGLIAFLAGKTFRLTGSVPVLLLGGGMVVFSACSAVSGLVLRPNDAVAIHNVGAAMAGVLSLWGAIGLLGPYTPSQAATSRTLTGTYTLLILLILAVATLGDRNWLPTFFVNDVGPTALRQVVLAIAIGEFSLAALVLIISARRSGSRFFYWYALGLTLIAIGLAGILGITRLESVLNWGGRLLQYLGGVYLLLGAIAGIRQTRGWTIPLDELRETHDRYTRLLEVGPDAIIIHTRDRLEYANSAAARLFGVASPAQLLGRNIVDFAEPQSRPTVQTILRLAGKPGLQPSSAEIVFSRSDGGRVRVDAWAAAVEYQGKPATQAVLRDITARRLVEESLLETERRFATLFNANTVGIMIASVEGKITVANDYFLELLGYSRAELEAGNLNSPAITPPEYSPADQAALEELQRNGVCHDYKKEYLRRDGTRVPVLTSGARIPGREQHVLAIVHDLRQQRAVEEDLQAARMKAEAASAAKDRFLATLSHELRTPLTPVLAAAQLMEMDGELPKNIRENAELIRRNAELESRLIDDLLDLTRIEHGKLQLNLAPVSMHRETEHVIRICSEDIRGKRQELQIQLCAAEDVIQGDATRIQQILWNLLRNAAKYTPEGGSIRLKTTNLDSLLRLTVEDNGVGIAASDLQRIFHPFEQLTPTTSGSGGLGLGLAICKNLVDLHAGQISVASPGVGQGTCFTLDLPLASHSRSCTRAPASPAVDAQSVSGRRVLLVEDHPDTARLMVHIIRAMGCQVRIAHTVAHAIKLIDRSTFHLLVSDLGLPDGSGHQIMRCAREHGLAGLALSGYGQDDDLQRSKESGFAAHLTKPVSIPQLRATIVRLLSEVRN